MWNWCIWPRRSDLCYIWCLWCVWYIGVLVKLWLVKYLIHCLRSWTYYLANQLLLSHMGKSGKKWYACVHDTTGVADCWASWYVSEVLTSLCHSGWVKPQIWQLITAHPVFIVKSSFPQKIRSHIVLLSLLSTTWYFSDIWNNSGAGNMHNCMDWCIIFKFLILAEAQIFIASHVPDSIFTQEKDAACA